MGLTISHNDDQKAFPESIPGHRSKEAICNVRSEANTKTRVLATRSICKEVNIVCLFGCVRGHGLISNDRQWCCHVVYDNHVLNNSRRNLGLILTMGYMNAAKVNPTVTR
jgi:hypothetical protein